MRAEIISVGTELLLGQTTDTNATYLSKELAARGIDLWYRQTVGDNFQRMKQVISQALNRSDILILIGGLGPTDDDLTKEAASEVCGIPLVNDPESESAIREFFKRRNIAIAPSNLKQALKPERGVNLKNPNGTAPGAVFDLDDKAIICLPGPPSELIPMWTNEAAPWLEKRGFVPGDVLRSRILRLVGIGESQIQERIRDLLAGGNPTVAPYAKTGEVHLRITAKASDEKTAFQMISEKEDEIRNRVGDWIYGTDDETLETVVIRSLLDKGLTIATAESCTGGLIASRLTDVSGSSGTFLAGLVCYANEIKTNVLGVTEDLIQKYGAVSEQVAKAMAEGAMARSGADIAVSDTGIAGPTGGTDEKPVGTVWIGLATKNGVEAFHNLFAGERKTVKLRTSQAALALVLRTVKDLL